MARHKPSNGTPDWRLWKMRCNKRSPNNDWTLLACHSPYRGWHEPVLCQNPQPNAKKGDRPLHFKQRRFTEGHHCEVEPLSTRDAKNAVDVITGHAAKRVTPRRDRQQPKTLHPFFQWRVGFPSHICIRSFCTALMWNVLEPKIIHAAAHPCPWSKLGKLGFL